MASVIPLLLLNPSSAVPQSAQAVAPCHAYGGNSSMIDDGVAHVASATFVSPLFMPSRNRFTVAATSPWSDALAKPAASAIPSAAMNVRIVEPPLVVESLVRLAPIPLDPDRRQLRQ